MAKGNFGTGFQRTSHIESVWGHLKSIIKNIYYSITNRSFILFLREAEFRRSMTKFYSDNKWQEFIEVLNLLLTLG